MRYVQSRADQANKEWAYRIYVTDGLRGLVNRNATRYADLWKKPDTRTSADIVEGIRAKLGGQ